MQEAGHELERSTALGVMMENEERRLMEAVRRCDVWATCASLVLGVQVELLIGCAQAADFEEWHEAFRMIYTAASALSLMCMGWVAYDVLRSAEEAQALAHARPVSSGSSSWMRFNKTGRNVDGNVYPPLATMRAAVQYLHQCLRDMRQVFNVGLLMAATTYFSFVGTYAPPDSPSFITGVLAVVLIVVVRQLWRRRLRRVLRTPPEKVERWSVQSWISQPLADGLVGGHVAGRPKQPRKRKVAFVGRLALRPPRRRQAADAGDATASTPSSSMSGVASTKDHHPMPVVAAQPAALVMPDRRWPLMRRSSALSSTRQSPPPGPRLIVSPSLIRLREQMAQMAEGGQGHSQPVVRTPRPPPPARTLTESSH